MRRILLFALVVGLAQLASAVNFDQCLANINNITIDGKLDNHGRPLPVSANNATAITFNLCVSQCGAGQEPFQWPVFSQQFNAWLLPWLALISQLPYGADDITNNLESMILTVGSPTLAAYSLALTALNGQWIARRFSNYRHEANVQSAVRVLSSLQQSPLRILDDAGLASLIILPQNDQWWHDLVKSLQYPHSWTISSRTSIAWVVIAYIFTLVDYFTQSAETNRNTSGGSVGTLWLWLLPIVFGWLHLSPKCNFERLNEAVETANTRAHVANTSTGPPIQAVTNRHTLSLDFSTTDDARLHERITAPIFNYARFLPWVQAVMVVCDKFDNVCDRNLQNEEIAPEITWRERKSGGWEQLTSDQVTDYCLPRPGKRRRPEWRLDGSVYFRMFIASALALWLQWGTTGAAIVVVWFTPTIGLGCRSLSYIVYGGASTLVWMMLLTSSILTFYSTEAPARAYPGFLTTLTFRSRAIRRLAICFRQGGMLIAAVNALLIMATSLFQFSGFYDRCLCNSSVFGLKKRAYNVISLTHSDGKTMLHSWYGGIALALVASTSFACLIGLFVKTASTSTKKYPRTS